MESNRQTVGKALLSVFTPFVAAGVGLLATGHIVWGAALVAAGGASVAAGLWMLLRRPKRLVVPAEVARAFGRSGSIMGEPPRYDSTLRERR
jgi:hypothetical protein